MSGSKRVSCIDFSNLCYAVFCEAYRNIFEGLVELCDISGDDNHIGSLFCK